MGGFAQFLRNATNMADTPVATMAPPDAMQAPVQMSSVQHPMHAVLAPIGPPAPEMPALPGMAPEGPKGMVPSAPKKMSPLDEQESQQEKRLMADYAKDNDPWGSADNHPGFLGQLGHGLSVLAQNAQHEKGRLTPREAEEARLQQGIQGLEGERSKEALEGATAARTQEEMSEMPGKTQSEEDLQQSEIAEHNAQAAALLHPQAKTDFEAWEQQNPGKPIEDWLKTVNANRPQTPQEETYQDLIKRGSTPEQALEKTKEHPPNVSVSTGEKNLWSVPRPDGSKKVVELHPGDTIPQGAVSLSGQSQQNSKEGSADAPTISALKFANDYLKSGQYTGPSDEALQDQFFQMAKPSTGFRMNQAQINQLHQMQSWVNSAEGFAYHAQTGTWFSPEQRKQIVQTMNELGRSKGINVEERQPAVGDPVMLHGQKVIIKKIYPDGTFDY